LRCREVRSWAALVTALGDLLDTIAADVRAFFRDTGFLCP
jgi:hypothetical protein